MGPVAEGRGVAEAEFLNAGAGDAVADQ